MFDNPLLYESIRRYAVRLLSDTDAANDVVQEVFLRFNQHQNTIEQPRAWAYRTARNLVIDRFRQTKTTVLSETMPAEAGQFNPVLLTEKKEEFEMIQQKINRLSIRHREVLRLKFQEGLKYTEIADVIGEPVTTVAWLIHEAVTLLRKEFTSDK
ncbi:MAG: sigma-70 family RNA polymerase sigma factor [Planctomycetaceae bacterium]|jgi:RNA polymerase sigma-70 factor (ECF subfamily)|nr:sigma-70 family RNA polymerase sigma factor [Planctomycetaceae bacterium]